MLMYIDDYCKKKRNLDQKICHMRQDLKVGGVTIEALLIAYLNVKADCFFLNFAVT